MDKPKLLLRREDKLNPEEVARAVLDGKIGAEALLDDDVYTVTMEQALGVARKRAAKELSDLDRHYENAVATRFGKALGDEGMSLFGIDPLYLNQLSEAQLNMYATRVVEGLAGQLSSIERQQYQAFGAGINKAIQNLKVAQQEAAKAIMGDQSVDQAPSPQKNKGKTVNTKGKTAYQYDKKNGGKSPEKAPKSKKGPAAPGGDVDQPQPVSEPPQEDPKALADKLGVKVEALKETAKRLERSAFIAYFMRWRTVVKKFNLTAQYLSSLYDVLTQPPAPPPSKTKAPPGAPSPAAQPAAGAAVAPAMGKAILHFVGAASDVQSQHLMDLLKSSHVHNQAQMVRVIQKRFAVPEDVAIQSTRTLLRQWESEAIVTVTPT